MNLTEAINILKNANYLVEASESDAYRAAKHIFTEFENKNPERVKKYEEKLKNAGIQDSWQRHYFKSLCHTLKVDGSDALYYIPGLLRLILINNVPIKDIHYIVPILDIYAKDGKKEIIQNNGQVKIKTDRYLNGYYSYLNKNNQYSEYEKEEPMTLTALKYFLSDYKTYLKPANNKDDEHITKTMNSAKTDYKIVKLNSYADLKPYEKYLSEYRWCYLLPNIFNYAYANRNVNMYLALKPGFDKMKKTDPGFKDSIIGIDVGLSSKTGKPFLAAATARTNHMTIDGKPDFQNPKSGDHCYDPDELSEILGCPYYIACPPPEFPVDPDEIHYGQPMRI